MDSFTCAKLSSKHYVALKHFIPYPHKHLSCTCSSNSLKLKSRLFNHEQILLIVFEFIGPGHWIFVGSVCKKWKRCYIDIASRLNWFAGSPYSTTNVQYSLSSLPRLKYAVSSGLNISSCNDKNEICNFARIAGSTAKTDVIRWAKSNGMPWYSDVAIGAARAGKLETLKWIHRQICFGWTWPSFMEKGMIAVVAAVHGHINILDWMWRERGGSLMKDLCLSDFAAMSGSITVLNWMKEVKCFRQQDLPKMSNSAAFFGQYKVILWVHNEGHVLDSATFSSAIASGNLTFVKWLYSQGCKYNLMEACLTAAFVGKIELISWLRSISTIELDETYLTVILLASGSVGHINLFKWARQQGAPWLPAVFVSNPMCVRVWRLPILKWAIPQGCPWGEWNSALCKRLERTGIYTAELNWAHKNGCPCTCERV